MKLVIEDKIKISLRELQKFQTAYVTLKQSLTYKNPKFIENEKYGYSNYETPKYLYSFKVERNEMSISRGALKKVIAHFEKYNIKCDIFDRTLTLPTMEFKHSKTVLRDEQRAFKEDAIKHGMGILLAYTSFGKSVTVLEIIRELEQPAMIITHTSFLQEQWINEATDSKLFNMDKKDIGGVGGLFSGKKRKLGKINICMYHSLKKQEHLDFFKESVSIVVMDECLSPDTLISTPDGIKTIDSLNVGDFVLSPSGESVKIKNKWETHKEAFEYETNNGETIIASENHLMQTIIFQDKYNRNTNKSKLAIANIGGCYDLIPYKSNIVNKGIESMSDYIYGFYMADGGSYSQGGIVFNIKKPEKIKQIVYALDKLGTTYTRKEYSGVTRITIRKDELPFKYKTFNLTGDKMMEDELFFSCSVSFLQGLFDGDGSADKNCVSITIKNKDFAISISKVLRAIGIPCSLMCKNDLSRIDVRGSGIKQFNNVIGFRIPFKQNKLTKYVNEITQKTYTVKIKSSKPVGKKRLIDIELDNEEKLFIANGLVSHNCQKAPIDDVQFVVNSMRAKYKFGVTAGVKRKDGKEFLTYDTFGDVIHKAIEKDSASKILADIRVIPSTYEDIDYAYDNDYNMMLARMAVNKERNIAICRRVLRQIKNNKLCIIFVERKAQALILAQYLSKYRVDMLLGVTNWKEYDIEHRIEKSMKEREPIPESAKIMMKAITPNMLNILKEYDAKGAFERISNTASKKQLDVIIGTQKAEVGLSIRTIDYGIVTTPMGNNLERFNQTLGRVERNYKQKEVDYFGHEKPTPVLEVIEDNLKASINAIYNIETKYGVRVRTIKTK